MSRTFKDNKEKRAKRFFKSHSRRVGSQYSEGWDKAFSLTMRREWEEKHSIENNPPKSSKNNPNQKK